MRAITAEMHEAILDDLKTTRPARVAEKHGYAESTVRKIAKAVRPKVVYIGRQV